MMPRDAGRHRRLPWVARVPFLFVSVLVLVGLLLLLQVWRETEERVVRSDRRALLISSGAALQRFALSFDSLLADVYWIRAIQHYGGTKRDEGSTKQYELLYPLLDITTTLDPRFNIAYRFGAIFLAEGYPDGPGRPDQAVALLQKGVRAMPERWQYLQDIGFVYYWWLHDYEEAARWFRRASEVPGAPWWLRSLAANTLALGGNRADARTLWGEIRQSSDNAWMRREAERRLHQLDAMDQIDQYTQIVRRFAQREGRWPRSWRDLAEGQSWSEVPLDPAGVPYVLDPGSGAIVVSSESPLFPLPEDFRMAGTR